MELKKYKKWFAVSLVVSASSLAIILMLSSTGEAQGIIFTLAPWSIIAALSFTVLAWVLWSMRIMVLVHALGGSLKFTKAFKIVMASVFVAAVTPSSIGGEPMRIYMLSQESITRGGMSTGDATALTIGERLIDFMFFAVALPILFLVVGLSIDLEGLKYFLIGSALLLALGSLFVAYVALHPHKFKDKVDKLDSFLKIFIKNDAKRWKTIRKIEKEFDAFSRSIRVIFKKKRGHFLLTFLLTSGIWILHLTTPSLILMGFGLEPMWLVSMTFQLIIALVTMIPVSPGGSGLAEFSAYLLYSQKIPKEYVGPMVLVWRVLTFYMNMIFGLIFTLHYIAKGE